MMHKRRTWQITDIAGPFELAYKLTQQQWCICQGFRMGPYLYLNDATSENGAQEYAIVREADMRQVESITFSWIDEQTAWRHIWAIASGGADQTSWTSGITAQQIQTTAEHVRNRPSCCA